MMSQPPSPEIELPMIVKDYGSPSEAEEESAPTAEEETPAEDAAEGDLEITSGNFSDPLEELEATGKVDSSTNYLRKMALEKFRKGEGKSGEARRERLGLPPAKGWKKYYTTHWKPGCNL